MHKGVILLTKATDSDEAVVNVENFLEDYGDSKVWDWYVVGGRWSGTLNSKSKEFFEKSEEHFKATYPEYTNERPFLTTKMVEEQAAALETIWDTIGGIGKNPLARNQYTDRTGDDDTMPLTECLEVVKTWTKDFEKEAEVMWNKMTEAKANKDGHDMSPYYASRYAELKHDMFCFESNVFDIETHTNNPDEAIKNADQYFAVMVDMHN